MTARDTPANTTDLHSLGDNAWYLRRAAKVEGPYPAGLISRYVLLGRVQPVDEVSQDGRTWQAVSDVPGLVPEILRADPGDPQSRLRLEAARRWADERLQPGERHGDAERRAPEAPERLDHRESLTQRLAGRRVTIHSRLSPYLLPLLIIALFVIIGLQFIGERDLGGPTQCQAAPRPGINWSSCQLAGARLPQADLANANLGNADLSRAVLHGSRLSKADLRYANAAQADLGAVDLQDALLVGSNLRGADLSGANLRGADLSYADLTAANLDEIDLQGARLDHAIWRDGTTCLAGSLGQCLVVD